MRLTFLGAADTVTGSCYLIESGTKKFLIDCGMFQGIKVETRNNDEFQFNPKDIDFVILTHAHMDHSGLLPKLSKGGFSGEVYLTPPTSALSDILLLDAAKIQENKGKHYSEAMPYKSETSLYDTQDSLNIISKFKSITFEEVINIEGGIKFKFIKAGHILGAASIVLKVEEKTFVFSGDLGRKDQSIIDSYRPLKLNEGDFGKVDFVIMESLYGGEIHPHRDDSIAKLLDVINRTLDRNGNVMIPCFSVHRTQEILEILKLATDRGLIRDNVQVILDSPLAIKATKVYNDFSTYFNSEFSFEEYTNLYSSHQLGNGLNSKFVPQSKRFSFESLKIINRYKQSLRAAKGSRSIFIAGSGMADGGRILNHLSAGISNPDNSVIFVGYQAVGTLGRKITEGASSITINKRKINVKAEVVQINGFSAHGDSDDLNAWLDNVQLKDNARVFLVHAEPERSIALKGILVAKGYSVTIPKWKSSEEIY